ncbi:hypothetical protein U9M48_034699 [Paspalum notatum var. saurae]|uniref:Protein kinase domain-containing protein n=1 Tax=Paspalum notatum var. saurae TaxID=547442 RepID=A0AAQ3X868_PASNO
MRRYQCLTPPPGACSALLLRLPLLATAVLAVVAAAAGGQAMTIGLPNCTTNCGGVDVPYPFGIEPWCHLQGLKVTCDLINHYKAPWLMYLDNRVVNISLDDSTLSMTHTGGVPISPAVGISMEVLLFAWELRSADAFAPNETRAGNATCLMDSGSTACHSSHSTCRPSTTTYPDGRSNITGYVCRCDEGYKGNAYLSNGCQDIDECALPDNCFGNCTNLPGKYLCECPKGTTGNAYFHDGCVKQHYPNTGNISSNEQSSLVIFSLLCLQFCVSLSGLIIGLGVGSGAMLLFVVLGTTFVIHKIKMWRKKRVRLRFFIQKSWTITTTIDIAERMIVPLEELQKATNNFDKAREIGGGGHGTVYKGILSSLHVVAIKKSKIVIQKEIDEFINEVAILSQMNHRNIVKLLGCCLETEVPLLVYEFVSNGSLHNHLHGINSISISWRDRFRIAVETARALAYLHSLASTPIIHRDVKSPNILLDDNLTVKLSNFGASRYVPTYQTGLDTTVQGTFGYLDPTYHRTGHLTEKSDVYSFVVLMIELLTRKKRVSYRSAQGHSLMHHFVTPLSEGKLNDMLDPQVIREGAGEVIDIAFLAAICVKLVSNDRPTMRQVEMTLESIYAAKDFLSSDDVTEDEEFEETTDLNLKGPFMGSLMDFKLIKPISGVGGANP